MKKSILTLTVLIAGLLIVAAPLYADDKLIMTTPELLLTGGGSFNEVNKSVSIKFTLQETLCYGATNVCVNPSIMWLVTDDPTTNDFSDKINIGAGFDYKHKFPKGSNNSMYVELGPILFIKELDQNTGNKINIHTGAGIEYKRFILSVDMYGVNDGLTMLNVGYRL